MKKISVGLVVIGILVIGFGAILSFSLVSNKDKEKDKEKENVKVVTLKEIDDQLKASDTFIQYSNYFNITTKIESNKYVIEYQGKTRAYTSSNGSVTFNLNDNILSTELASDNLLYMNQNFVNEVLRAICILRGLEPGLVDRSLTLVTFDEATLDANGYMYDQQMPNFIFKIRLDKDIILPDLKNSYIAIEEFKSNESILGNEKAVGEYQKGNISFFYNNQLKYYYIYEYGKNGENTYKTLVNMVEFFLGKEEAENLKKEMPTLADGTYGKVTIDVDYKLAENEILYSSTDKSVYENEYSLIKIIIK